MQLEVVSRNIYYPPVPALFPSFACLSGKRSSENKKSFLV
jgi:hypothetical protein